MSQQTLDPLAIQHAEWLAASIATIVAAVLAGGSYALYRTVATRTQMRLLASLSAVISSAAAYILSVVVLVVVLHRLVNPSHESGEFIFRGGIWVEPAWIQKLLPLAGICMVWLYLFISTLGPTLQRRSN